jgi:hypothetical protein
MNKVGHDPRRQSGDSGPAERFWRKDKPRDTEGNDNGKRRRMRGEFAKARKGPPQSFQHLCKSPRDQGSSATAPPASESGSGPTSPVVCGTEKRASSSVGTGVARYAESLGAIRLAASCTVLRTSLRLAELSIDANARSSASISSELA